MRHRLTRSALVVATTLTAVGGASPHADARRADPPVAKDMTIVVTRSSGYADVAADVLARADNPQAAHVRICRIDAQDDAGVGVHVVPYLRSTPDGPVRTYQQLAVDDLAPTTPTGRYPVTFYLCDDQGLTPATLTVDVRRIEVRTVEGRPGVLRFTNTWTHDVVVAYWPVGTRDWRPVEVPAGASRTRKVDADSIRWMAFDAQGDESLPLDQGRVAHVQTGVASPTPPPPTLRQPATDDGDTTPPVTAPEAVTVEYGGTVEVPVLANDSDDHPDSLAVCRATSERGSRITARPEPLWATDWHTGPRSDATGTLALTTSKARGGTYTVTYQACDRHQLSAPTTVTVRVRPFPRPVLTHPVGRPGVIVVRNRGYRPIDLDFDGGISGERGRQARVAAHATGMLRVPWQHAFFMVSTAIGPLSQTTLRHLQD